MRTFNENEHAEKRKARRDYTEFFHKIKKKIRVNFFQIGTFPYAPKRLHKFESLDEAREMKPSLLYFTLMMQ